MPYTGIPTLFQQLVANTQLSAAAYTDASGKHQRVRDALNRAYYGISSGSANSFLVGSYGKNTEIRPPSDVDILFELPWSTFTRISQRTGNVQSQLLQEVRSYLLSSFSTTSIKADGQVILVPFTTFAVEVLPAFQISSGQYWHGDSNGGGSWRTTDPVAEQRAIVTANSSSGGKAVHLIKLLKAWKNVRNVKIKSFVLELLASRFIPTWQYNVSNGSYTGYSFYDFMIRDFFADLVNQANRYLLAPGVAEVIYTGDTWKAQAQFASSASSRATAYGADDKLSQAKSEWGNIFGSYLP